MSSTARRPAGADVREIDRARGLPPTAPITATAIARALRNAAARARRTDGKPARTRYRVLSRDADSALLELEPLTGRSHQLRVHLVAIGHPILGDRLYAPPAIVVAAPRLMLHAWSLELDHPYRGERLRFEAPVPAGLG